MEHIRHGIKRIGTSILLLLLTLLMLPAGSAQAATKIKGIDVSRWQGKVDWKKVKASGVEFVMLGIGRYHNGVRVPDTEFTYNITNALANGIHVGVYLYSEAGDVKTAKKEAQFMLDMIDGYKISYPVAFDIEDDVHRKMTTKQRTDITIAFLEESPIVKRIASMAAFRFFSSKSVSPYVKSDSKVRPGVSSASSLQSIRISSKVCSWTMEIFPIFMSSRITRKVITICIFVCPAPRSSRKLT